MKIGKHFFGSVIGAGLVTVALSGGPVSAAATSNIGISPVYPDNQITANGIFDLKVQPGQAETLKLKIANLSHETQKLIVQTTTAYTNDAGTMALDHVTVPKNKSRQVDFRRLVAKRDRKQVVTVPAGEITMVEMPIKVPSKAFDGIVVGGVLVKSDDQASPFAKKGVSVKNKFAYAMGVVLKESDQTAVPKLTMGKIQPKIVGNDIKIKTVYKNNKPAIISDMTLHAKITNRQTGQVMGKTADTGMSVAPNSTFNYANNWHGHKIKPGSYHYHATITAANGQHWQLDKNFKVGVAGSFVMNQHCNPWLSYVIIGILVLLLIIMIAVIIYKRLKREQEKRFARQLTKED